MSRFLTKILNDPPGTSAAASPPTQTSLSREDSLSTDTPTPPPAASPVTQDSPSTVDNPEAFNVISLLPDAKGHTQLPHRYTDHLPRWLSSDEQAVYIQLYRLSWGWGRELCFVSNPKLAERSGVPETTMRRAVKKLIGKGLIQKTDRKFGGSEQGIEYRVFSLDRLSAPDRASTMDSLSAVAPNKERIKEISKAASCPDCMGTGFYYPEGTAKGVKRCEHRKVR